MKMGFKQDKTIRISRIVSRGNYSSVNNSLISFKVFRTSISPPT